MRVCLLVPHPGRLVTIAGALREQGYGVEVLRSRTALIARIGACDAAVLDGDALPADVRPMLAAFRRAGTSRLLLVAHSLDQCVRFLDAGADDCIRTPLFVDELVSRLRRLLRRTAAPDSRIRHGPLQFDAGTRVTRFRREVVELTALETALLEALLDPPGATIARKVLEERLYGWSRAIRSNTVQVHIHALRRKLDPALIRTIQGVGYSLEALP